MMNKKRQVYLFGAGAVIDWGGPKTTELTKLVRETGVPLKNSGIKITEFIYQKLINAGFDSKSDINFETIISVIEELLVYYSEFNTDRSPSLLKPFLRPYDLNKIFNYSIIGGKREHGFHIKIAETEDFPGSLPALENETPTQYFLQILLSYLLIVINGKVSKYSWHTSSHSVIDTGSENSLNFRKWIKTDSEHNVKRLYTLNYDNLFKTLIEQDNKDCFDGFKNNGTESYSDVDIKRIITDFESTVHYNLHGSSYWRVKKNKPNYPEIVHEGGISLHHNPIFSIIEKGKTLLVSNIITGYQKAQKSRITPFRQMQSAFDRDCLFADKISIVGYSFGDEHINEAIKTAFYHNPDLVIEIVEPNFVIDQLDLKFTATVFPIANMINKSDAENNFYSYLDNRIQVHTLYFSDFLKRYK